MTQVAKMVLVALPGTDTQAYPVRLFPGATAGDLIGVLRDDPEFPAVVSADQHRVVTVLPSGKSFSFDDHDDLYGKVYEKATLELLPRHAPVLG